MPRSSGSATVQHRGVALRQRAQRLRDVRRGVLGRQLARREPHPVGERPGAAGRPGRCASRRAAGPRRPGTSGGRGRPAGAARPSAGRLRAVAAGVVEPQLLLVAAGLGDRDEHVGVDRRAAAGRRPSARSRPPARRPGGAAASAAPAASFASARSEVSSMPVDRRRPPRCAGRRRSRPPRRRRAAAAGAAAPAGQPVAAVGCRGWRPPGSRARAAGRRRGAACAR